MTEESIFLAALDINSPEERQAFLVDACAADTALLARVQRLLGADAGDCGILDRSVPGKIASVFVPQAPVSRIIAGRYKLIEEIGEGGMGTVWMAEQIEPVRRQVAVKLIKLGMDSRQLLARFEAERQALALMDHPNIAKVLDGGVTGGEPGSLSPGRPYFVMEYVKGVPITEYCDAARLSVTERLDLFVLVCSAVQHAHQKGIIHRDLKPSNILIAPYDDRPVPKVIDFGLAKALHGGLTERTLHTAHGTVMGTPLYMSPEQAQLNNLDVDTRSDVYSLGVLLYELLTGTTPLEKQRFKEAAWDEICRVLREEDPPRPSTRLSSTETLPSLAACRRTEAAGLTKQVRGELDWIVMKALEKNRNRRYDSAASFAQDVQRYLAGEPVQAVPPSAGYRLRKFARKHKAALTTALVVTLLLVAGVVVSTWQAVRATSAETNALVKAEEARVAQKEADHNADRARANERLAYDRAYNSDLRLLQQAWEKNQFDYVRDLLERQRPERTDANERRGVEWDYWNRQVGLRVLTFARHPAAVGCVAFSPDGSVVASGGAGGIPSRKWVLEIWDARTAKPIHSLSRDGQRITGVAFSPDGKRLVSTSDESVARVWDVQTGKELFVLEGHDAKLSVNAVACSRDGQHVATASRDSTVRLWDAASGKARHILRNTSPVFCIAFSPDGARLATVDEDRVLRVWEVATGKSLMTLTGSTKVSWALAYSPDGMWIASAGYDGRVMIHDAASGKERRILNPGGVRSLAFSPDSRWLASASDGVKVWDVESGQHLFTFKGQTGILNAVEFSPDGTRLVSGDSNGTVAVWDATAARTAAIPSPSGSVLSLAVGAEGKLIYGGFTDGLIRVWDCATGRELRAFGTQLSSVTQFPLAVHPAGRKVVSQGRGAVVEVWDPQDGKRLRELPRAFLRAAEYSPDGEHLATLDTLGGAQIRSAATLEPVRVLRADGFGFALAYTRQGDYLALRDGGGVTVWEVATGRLAAQLDDSTDFVGPLAFSPDGESLATGNQSGIVLVWQWRTDRPARRLTGHTDMVSGVAYSPDGKRLASSGRDGSVKVWDPAAGEELLNFTVSDAGKFHCVAFSRDGKRLFAGVDGGVRSWEGAR